MKRWLPLLPIAALLLGACSTAKRNPIDTSRRVGEVAGVIAAVLGGSGNESIDDSIDRYRRTRDAVTIAGVIIAAASEAVQNVERDSELDDQFAALQRIEGLSVTRPYPDLIEVRLPASPTPEMLAALADVLSRGERRAIDVEGAGDSPLEVREALIRAGVGAAGLNARRNNEVEGIVVRIRYDG